LLFLDEEVEVGWELELGDIQPALLVEPLLRDNEVGWDFVSEIQGVLDGLRRNAYLNGADISEYLAPALGQQLDIRLALTFFSLILRCLMPN